VRVGDLVKVTIGPNCFRNMMGIVSTVFIDDSLGSNRGRLVAEIFDLEDMGGDSYDFYVDTLEVISEGR
jgi:hypothetical protein